MSFERSRTNAIGPAFSSADCRGTAAYRSFLSRIGEGQAWALSSCEGELDFPQKSVLVSDSSPVHRALLQGDARSRVRNFGLGGIVSDCFKELWLPSGPGQVAVEI